QLDWIIEGKHVPFYVARYKGFFEKNGLEVTLLEGKGSANSSTFVDLGQADYSYGDFLTAVQVMSKGGKKCANNERRTLNTAGVLSSWKARASRPQRTWKGKASAPTRATSLTFCFLPLPQPPASTPTKSSLRPWSPPCARRPCSRAKSISCPAPTVPAFNGW